MTGFAVRVLPHLRDRYETIYEGFFFESGVVGPARNGEPCLPTTPNDPLGAMRLRIIDHQSA
jgi:hypothetical protein